MATESWAGINWLYEDGLFMIFDKQGALYGAEWAVSREGLGDLVKGETTVSLLTTIHPAPKSGQILKMIDKITRENKPESIAYIGVQPLMAIYLALEGVITLELLKRSDEVAGRIIMDVRLAGTPYKLVIAANATQLAAAYDRHDQIL